MRWAHQRRPSRASARPRPGTSLPRWLISRSPLSKSRWPPLRLPRLQPRCPLPLPSQPWSQSLTGRRPTSPARQRAPRHPATTPLPLPRARLPRSPARPRQTAVQPATLPPSPTRGATTYCRRIREPVCVFGPTSTCPASGSPSSGCARLGPASAGGRPRFGSSTFLVLPALCAPDSGRPRLGSSTFVGLPALCAPDSGRSGLGVKTVVIVRCWYPETTLAPRSVLRPESAGRGQKRRPPAGTGSENCPQRYIFGPKSSTCTQNAGLSPPYSPARPVSSL